MKMLTVASTPLRFNFHPVLVGTMILTTMWAAVVNSGISLAVSVATTIIYETTHVVFDAVSGTVIIFGTLFISHSCQINK